MLSQLAATVGFFRSLGIRAEVSHLAFEPAILDALPPAPTEAVDISFVGTHQQRVALLEAIARTLRASDFKDNLQTLFEPSREVVAWRSVNECLSMIDRYLNDEDERTAVAMASQDTFDAHVPATRGRHPAIRRQKLGWLRSNDRSRCALDGAVQNGQSTSV